MIVRTVDEIRGSDREIRARTGTWLSRRFLLKSDGMGFSFHETTIFAGSQTTIWYKNHLEAVFCVGGEGELEVADTGKIYPIKDGTMYALNEHERHFLRAKSDMRLICVFNPPVTGQEDHDADGVYPLIE